MGKTFPMRQVSPYYNPETARFLTEDTYYGSTADPLSLNLYTYCANNPIIYIDPTGHALTQWDVDHCSAAEIATIIAATEAWNAANAAGDATGMLAAQQAAADARSDNLSDNEEQLSNGIVVDTTPTEPQTTYAWVGEDEGIVEVTVPASITTDSSGSTTAGGTTSSTPTTAATTNTPTSTTSGTQSTAGTAESGTSSSKSTAASNNTSASTTTQKASNDVNSSTSQSGVTEANSTDLTNSSKQYTKTTTVPYRGDEAKEALKSIIATLFVSSGGVVVGIGAIAVAVATGGVGAAVVLLFGGADVGINAAMTLINVVNLVNAVVFYIQDGGFTITSVSTNTDSVIDFFFSASTVSRLNKD